MSGRAPQKPPKDALRIRVESSAEEQQIFEWLSVANGFPFHIPVLDETELYLSRDGRTVYGEKFLIRIGREDAHTPIPAWDYQVNAAGDELVRKRFAYPIVRSLWDYAPGVASRIGLPTRTVTLKLFFGGEMEICPRCGERAASPLEVLNRRVGYACAACRRVGVDR